MSEILSSKSIFGKDFLVCSPHATAGVLLSKNLRHGKREMSCLSSEED
jgi:hypothetical protein